MKLAATMLCLAVLSFPALAQETTEAGGGQLRWLDKVSGETADLDLAVGGSATKGRLTITLDECRYPTEDPSSDAFAHITISDRLVETPIFNGWMIASSPALNALDSSRYDVWVLRCTTS